MVYNEIRALLARYWEGETSLEEEELLRSFFTEKRQEIGEMPADLQEAAPLFTYFVAEQQREIAAPYEEERTTAKIITMPVAAKAPRPWQHWMKYAAVLLMAGGLTYSIQQYRIKQQQEFALSQEDTYQDPEKAYAATKHALELLAKNLNKGTSQAQKLSYFNEATEMIKAN